MKELEPYPLRYVSFPRYSFDFWWYRCGICGRMGDRNAFSDNKTIDFVDKNPIIIVQ